MFFFRKFGILPNIRVIPPWNFVPKSGLSKYRHCTSNVASVVKEIVSSRASSEHQSIIRFSITKYLVRQKWTLNVINCRRSSVEQSWRNLRQPMFDRRSVYHRQAARRAGPSATPDTCLFIYLFNSQLHKIHRVPDKWQSYRLQL